MNKQGFRLNSGKLRHDLLNPWAIERMVEVLTIAANSGKYPERNWERGMSWSKIIESIERHLSAIKQCEDFDSETKCLHAAHLACNTHFLLAYYNIYKQGDNRPRYFKNYRIGYDIDGVLADFGPHFLNFLNIEDKSDPTYWNDYRFTENLHKVCSNEVFWLSMPVQEDPGTLLYEPVAYISTRNCDDKFTKRWLQENGFPKAEISHLGHGSSKLEKCKELQLDYFVDDCYNNFCDLQNNGIKCFLYSRSHNIRYDVGQWRIDNLSDMNKKLSQ